MKTFAALLLFPALLSCQPIGGADPLDSVGSNSPLILASPEERSESSFRTRIGLETTADF